MYDRYQKSAPTDDHRLFLALLPDEQTVHRLVELQKGIKGRIIPRENLHLTLIFFGNQPKSRISELIAFIDTLIFRTFDLRIDRRGFFSRLKINWAGSKETHPELAMLHKTIWDSLGQDHNLESRTKHPFRPHITLARNAQPTSNILSDPFIWHVNRLALMESIISKKPGQSATYQILYEKQADNP